jgi:hypothetical protein
MPNANPTGQQKDVQYAGTKLYDALAWNIQISNHDKEVLTPVSQLTCRTFSN